MPGTGIGVVTQGVIVAHRLVTVLVVSALACRQRGQDKTRCRFQAERGAVVAVASTYIEVCERGAIENVQRER